MITITLTLNEKDALLSALRYSLDERESYFADGADGAKNEEIESLKAEIEATKVIIAKVEALEP